MGSTPTPNFNNTGSKKKPTPLPIRDTRSISKHRASLTPSELPNQVERLGNDPVVSRLQGQAKKLPGVTSQFATAGKIGTNSIRTASLNKFNKTYASPFIRRRLDEYRGEKKRKKVISTNSLVNEYANLST